MCQDKEGNDSWTDWGLSVLNVARLGDVEHRPYHTVSPILTLMMAVIDICKNTPIKIVINNTHQIKLTDI